MSQDNGKVATGGIPVAVVTGASSGTGRDIALALAADGCDVALLGRRVDALNAVKLQIEAMGRRACVLTTDLLDDQAISASMDAFFTWSQRRVDILVNAAGIPGPLGPPVGAFSVAEFDAVIATNLRAPFILMSHLLPLMYERNSGRVVNIGGNHGMRGRAGRSSYSSSKWALRGLTRSAALEAGQYGVTVNFVAPGPIAVERMRKRWAERAEAEGVSEQVIIDQYIADMGAVLRRPSETSDVVATVRFLVGEGGRNITGQELVVDGGVII